MTDESPDTGEDAGAEREGLAWRARVFVRWVRRALTEQLPAEEARAVRDAVAEEGSFSARYAFLCALSAGIATLGLLQSSPAVVIGAMLVSPLMGPIASLGFGFASFDGRQIQQAAKVVGVGALIGVTVGMLITGLSPVRNATPEIISRTAPTLLDLGVALLSGLAGGYASVHRKGEAAIGVAIATALMPPLATLGYSLAVWRLDLAFGAALLFLTNLAAIAFSFALVARQRGVARPLFRQSIKPLHAVLGLVAFLALATPLALTLHRIAQEAFAAVAVRRELAAIFSVEPSQVAQLSVKWTSAGVPDVEATVITPIFQQDAEAVLQERLTRTLRTRPNVRVGQVVAADVAAQTRAMIEAALTNQADRQPPIEQARAASTVPIYAAWADTGARTIYLSAAPLSGLSLADYRQEEQRLGQTLTDWRIAVVPPFQEDLFLPFADDSDAPDEATLRALEQVHWALARWSVRRVRVVGLDAERRNGALRELTLRRAESVRALLHQHGIELENPPAEPSADPGDDGALRADGIVLRARRAAQPTAAPTSADGSG